MDIVCPKRMVRSEEAPLDYDCHNHWLAQACKYRVCLLILRPKYQAGTLRYAVLCSNKSSWSPHLCSAMQ